MKSSKNLINLGIIIALVTVGIMLVNAYAQLHTNEYASLRPTASSSVQFVQSTITADGSVTAQSQAKLNFQAAGKLVYLPYKEGDTVTAGRTIARLDTYALQRQLTAALNTYKVTRDSFEQSLSNSQDNVSKSQLAASFAGANIDSSQAITDAITRLVDQSQSNLNNSVINVELANYSLQFSTLTSPINGIITHEDVNVTGINVTPLTSFTVQDPSTMVFRANVPLQNIYYVAVGSKVGIAVDGIPNKLTGTVSRIYPTKVTLASGEMVYQVDIVSDDLKKLGKLDEMGSAIISTNSQHVALVPAWTVLSGKYMWIDNNGAPELRPVTIGRTHGDQVEITGGLSESDKIIIDPKFISAMSYKLL